MSAVTRKSDTHEERYFHVPIFNEKVKMATVYSRKEENGWFASVSFCVHEDKFERHVGRQVARRRYFLEKMKMAEDPEYCSDLMSVWLPEGDEPLDPDYKGAADFARAAAENL